jgi:hypothetical protein
VGAGGGVNDTEESTHAHTLIHENTYNHTCTHTQLRTHTHTHTHMQMHTHTFTHTHTHTHLLQPVLLRHPLDRPSSATTVWQQ